MSTPSRPQRPYRSETVTVYLTAAEKRRLAAQATARGLSTSAMLRDLGLDTTPGGAAKDADAWWGALSAWRRKRIWGWLDSRGRARRRGADPVPGQLDLSPLWDALEHPEDRMADPPSTDQR